METVYFKRGDGRPKVVFTVTEDPPGALDFTTVTAVTFKFRLGSTVYTRTGAVESPATDKKVSYLFVSGDWSGGTPFVAGTYELEIKLTLSGVTLPLTVPTVSKVRFVVESEIP